MCTPHTPPQPPLEGRTPPPAAPDRPAIRRGFSRRAAPGHAIIEPAGAGPATGAAAPAGTASTGADAPPSAPAQARPTTARKAVPALTGNDTVITGKSVLTINVRYLLTLFSDETRKTVLAEGWEHCGRYVELFEPKERYTADRLYLVGKGAPFSPDIPAEAGATFILCDGEDADPPRGCSAICLDAPLARVYNTVMACYVTAMRWERELLDLARDADYQSVVRGIGSMGGRFTLLIGRSGRIVANTRTRLAGSITEKLALNDIAQLVSDSIPAGKDSWMVETDAGTQIWCRRLRHSDGEARILAMEDISGGTDVETLCALTANALEGVQSSESIAAMNAEMQVFCRCWQNIMDRVYVTNDEVRDALSRLPYTVKDFVSLAVITFPRRRSEIPYRDILVELRRLFPLENITLYEHDIVILLSQEERSFRPNFSSVDIDHLSNLLKQHDGMLAISAKTRRVDALPSFYYLAKRTALLAMALHDTASKDRIVYYEDYSIYCLIDMAVKQYLQNPVNDDVVYLVHSAVIQLTRYDEAHNTNLRDVLYHYLICDRNLVKTAAATYMHRNTVLNKINKITSLLDLDLEDPMLRQKLILSCQVILYIERAMNRTLNL